MRIEITTAYKMPSGTDPGTDVRVFHVPVKRGSGKQSSKIDILDPIPKVTCVDTPNPDANSGVKLPSCTVGLTILGMRGDLSDVGAKPRRVVHGRVVDEHLL
jgi:hypothetical protein